MAQPNQELLDAVELAFGGAFFEPIAEEDIASVNSTQVPEGYEPVRSGSFRVAMGYDPDTDNDVIAVESYLIGGHDIADLSEAHIVQLYWEGEGRKNCIIDLDYGEVVDSNDESPDTISNDWRRRVIGALSLVADQSMEMS